MSKSRSTPAAPPTRKHLARAAREQRQRRYLLIATVVVAVAVVAIIGFGVFQQQVLQPREAVARVGDQNITLGDFINFTRYQRMQLVQSYQRLGVELQIFQNDPQSVQYIQQQQQQIQTELSDPATLGKQVVDQMVDDLLIRMEAVKLGITVSPAEVDTAYKGIYGYFPNGTPTPTVTATNIPTDIPPTVNPTVVARLTALPSPTASPTLTPTETLTPTPTNTPGPSPTPTPVDTVTPTPTPFTTEGFGQLEATQVNAVQKESGISAADLRHLVESQLYHDKVEAALEAQVPTTGDESHARHILVTDLTTAQALVAQLRTGGGDFVALAAKYSTDTATKDNGGDLGWFAKGEVDDPAIDTVAFTQTVGAYSDPIPAQSVTGYEIVQVIERGQHKLSPIALDNARAAALQNWLDSQRSVTMADGRQLVQIFDTWQSQVPAQPDLSSVQ